MSQGSKWRTDARGPYIRMASGLKVYLADPTPEQIRLGDVVHHVARINRYTGADEYTIGQHMVVAARLAERLYPEHDLLPARMLIHDVAEHVLGDVSAPLKSLLPDYKALETRWDYAVEQKFGVTFIGDALVKEVDDRMWLTERLAVYGDAMLDGVDISEDYSGDLVPFELDDEEFTDLFYPWATDRVEEEYEIELARLVWPA
jgi:hypothetical protein